MVETPSTTNLLPRDQVARGDTWNAESVYPSADAIEAEFKAVSALLEKVPAFQGHLAEGPGKLADWMGLAEELSRRAYTLYFYGTMAQSVNTEDQAAAEVADRGASIMGRMQASIAFTDPELLAIGQEILAKWLATEPRLAHYQHYVDNLFRRQAHVSSADVEAVLGSLIDPFFTISNTAELLANSDIKFRPAVGSDGKELPVAQSTIGKLYSNTDREVRRTAWESYTDSYGAYQNTFASNLASAIKVEITQVRARRYGSALEAALFESNLPKEVFHNLIDTFRANLPTWHRYWRVRRKALKVDKLYPYDIWAPLTPAELNVPFDQSVEWIVKGLEPLGKEYVEILNIGVMKDRWVDRYPNQGKRQGAFSTGAPGTHPFIMMSYSGEIESVSTLAHELGHSMHSFFTWKTQPLIYTNYSIFVAEVASNFNQAMVRAYLLDNNADRDFQISVLEEAMSNFHRYLFIMPTLARFELEMHERIERGEATPATVLNELMADLFSEGYGGEMVVDRQREGITWATFPHLYVPFYVFQYATGISAANALAKRILGGDQAAAAKYLEFLKAGASVYPLDALKIAGIDMAKPDAVNEAFAVLSGLVDRLEKLVES